MQNPFLLFSTPKIGQTSFFHKILRGTFLHPQWLVHRFNMVSRKKFLGNISDSLILDVGSGDSNNTSLLKTSNTIYRLDYPETNKLYHNRPDIFGDACNLPIARESTDIVFLFEVIEHVSNYQDGINEVSRVLKSGGKFYLSVPFLYPTHDAPYDFQRLTIHGIRELLLKNHLVPEIEIKNGNSFIVVLQIFNLALLESTRDIYRKNKILGLVFGLFAYPLCLISNFLSLPLLLIKWNSAGYIGCFVIARRK